MNQAPLTVSMAVVLVLISGGCGSTLDLQQGNGTISPGAGQGSSAGTPTATDTSYPVLTGTSDGGSGGSGTSATMPHPTTVTLPISAAAVKDVVAGMVGNLSSPLAPANMKPNVPKSTTECLSYTVIQKETFSAAQLTQSVNGNRFPTDTWCSNKSALCADGKKTEDIICSMKGYQTAVSSKSEGFNITAYVFPFYPTCVSDKGGCSGFTQLVCSKVLLNVAADKLPTKTATVAVTASCFHEAVITKEIITNDRIKKSVNGNSFPLDTWCSDQSPVCALIAKTVPELVCLLNGYSSVVPAETQQSEFDITAYLLPGKNNATCVSSHKGCGGLTSISCFKTTIK
ncbi:hypothetical protein WDW37_10735 [Bdellovibrionota bacterium FG-1]